MNSNDFSGSKKRNNRGSPLLQLPSIPASGCKAFVSFYRTGYWFNRNINRFEKVFALFVLNATGQPYKLRSQRNKPFNNSIKNMIYESAWLELQMPQRDMEFNATRWLCDLTSQRWENMVESHLLNLNFETYKAMFMFTRTFCTHRVAFFHYFWQIHFWMRPIWSRDHKVILINNRWSAS